MDFSNELILTRFLYNKDHVKYSLLVTLIQHNEQESLFWGYELYFSGFQEELIDFIMVLYQKYYYFYNKKLLSFILTKINAWRMDISLFWNIGSILSTLAKRNGKLEPFWSTHFTFPPPYFVPLSIKAKINVHLHYKDVSHLLTVPITPPWKYLRTIRLYPLHVFPLFTSSYNIIDIYHTMYSWLFFASKSPIWKERISLYQGIVIDTLSQKITFDNDDVLEDFSQLWEFDVDELPLHSKQSLFGALLKI